MVYPNDAIVRASAQCDAEEMDPEKKGIKLSTLRRNPDVAKLIRGARGESPEPEPDFRPFGALVRVYSAKKRNRRRRARKFTGLNRADLAYWVVGYQELERHVNDLHTQLDEIDCSNGLWPAGEVFPNPPFEVSSTAVHRYQQLRSRETVATLREMLFKLQPEVEEHLKAIEVVQRMYVNQTIQ